MNENSCVNCGADIPSDKHFCSRRCAKAYVKAYVEKQKGEQMKDKWVKIGVCGVDSGQVVICDPCYIGSEWKGSDYDVKEGEGNHPKETKEFSYSGCCRATSSKKKGGQLNYTKGHAGVGVAASSGIGDGVYPVYVRYENYGEWGRRIAEMRIVFLPHPYGDLR